MKDPERRKHIQFMPLKTTVLLILASGCWFALAIGWNIFKGHGGCLCRFVCSFKSSVNNGSVLQLELDGFRVKQ